MSLDGFPRHFRETFPGLVGRRLVVALSGGGDSVALLHLLLDPSLGLELEAAHVHHGARGAEADADAAFCRKLCGELGVPFHLLFLPPVPPGAGSREAWWRARRYERLEAVRVRTGAAAVATGHQRDDVAEGVVVQLLRGGGPRALSGIAETTEDRVVRPLLPWSRETIRDWLRGRGIAWREDATNTGSSNLRSRVRTTVLPAMEAASPAVRRHLVRLAGDLAEAEAAFAAVVESLGAWIRPYSPRGVPVATVAALPAALRIRWLHAQAARAGIGPVSRGQVRLFHGLLDQGVPRGLALAGRWRLLSARGHLWLEPPAPVRPWELPLPATGTVELPLPGWRVAVVPRSGGSPSPWRAALPPGKLRIRSARPGDRAWGRRVAELLEPYPRHLRRAWPVVTLGDTIVWVPGTEASAGPTGAPEVEVICP